MQKLSLFLLVFLLAICKGFLYAQESINVSGVANGELIFKYYPMQTLKDGQWVTTTIIPDKNNFLISQVPNGPVLKSPITEVTFDIKQQKIPYVLASVKERGEEIVHSSTINYFKVDHILPKHKQTIILEPLQDSNGKVVEGYVLISPGSELVIGLIGGIRSLLAQPGNIMVLAPKLSINVDGVQVINETNKSRKYEFVLNKNGRLELYPCDKELTKNITKKDALTKTQSTNKNKLCTACNRMYPGDVNFCSIDGKQLIEYSEENLICPTCKEKAHPGDKFCKKDTTPLTQLSDTDKNSSSHGYKKCTTDTTDSVSLKANKDVIDLIKTWDERIWFFTSKNNPIKSLEGLKAEDIACYGGELMGHIEKFYKVLGIKEGELVLVQGTEDIFRDKNPPSLFITWSKYDSTLGGGIRVEFYE